MALTAVLFPALVSTVVIALNLVSGGASRSCSLPFWSEFLTSACDLLPNFNSHYRCDFFHCPISTCAYLCASFLLQVAMGYGTSNVLSFWTIAKIAVIWAFVSLPLVIGGTILGERTGRPSLRTYYL